MGGRRRSEDHDTRTALTRPDAGDGALCLLIVRDRSTSRCPLPERGAVTLGRSSRAQVVIDDPSVSRLHARLDVGERLTLTDLESKRGTRVGVRRLTPGEALEILVDEPFALGSVVVIVQRREAEEARGDAEATESNASPAMSAVLELIDRIAPAAVNVLIQGETGVGKERLAERVHARSPRASGPLVRINCGALGPTLIESELFGHERGAFTGAQSSKPGLIEHAEGGTVFLDEVGEIPRELQVKLLRVLEERQVRRVGGLTSRSVDVRFVAATNRSLEQEVSAGAFRADLYYRLAGVVVRVPPLRERREEIPALAAALLAAVAPGRRLSPQAVRALTQSDWPGNVRELKNVVERAALLAEGDTLYPEHLELPPVTSPALESVVFFGPSSSASVPAAPPSESGSLREAVQREVESVERARILDALAQTGWNQTKAAEKLGISRRTLISRLDAYGISGPRKSR